MCLIHKVKPGYFDHIGINYTKGDKHSRCEVAIRIPIFPILRLLTPVSSYNYKDLRVEYLRLSCYFRIRTDLVLEQSPKMRKYIFHTAFDWKKIGG